MLLVFTTAINIVVSTVLYRRFYLLGRQHRRQIEALEMAVLTHIRRETRSAHTMAMILGSMYVTHLPRFITAIVSAFKPLDPQAMQTSYAICALFALSNGACNTVIYCLRNKEVKERVMRLLGFNLPSPNMPPTAATSTV